MAEIQRADVFGREPNGIIALRITEDEWEELLIVLSYAAGVALRDDPRIAALVVGLTNRLNAGNTNFVPYEIPGQCPRGGGAATMTNTRDNYVAQAVRSGKCPHCAAPLAPDTFTSLGSADPVVCRCGFQFSPAEAARFVR